MTDHRDNSLRRRFEQNQTDCTYTILALLPTATDDIIEALPVEELTKELQQKRAERLARLSAGEATGSDMTSVSPSVTEEDRKSLSSEGYVHASQMAESGDAEGQGQPRARRNKTQLWNEVKITCMFPSHLRSGEGLRLSNNFQLLRGPLLLSTLSRCSPSSLASNSISSAAGTISPA